MLARLANVVYWACTAAAILWAAFALYAPSTQARPECGTGAMLALVISTPLWLFGRAVLYVITGK